MIRIDSRRGGKTATLTVALGLLGMAVAGQAGASCMGSTHSPTHDPSAMRLTPAVYRPGTGASFIRVSDSEDEHDSIVELWQFKFVGFGPDYGTQAWHSDGTDDSGDLGKVIFGNTSTSKEKNDVLLRGVYPNLPKVTLSCG